MRARVVAFGWAGVMAAALCARAAAAASPSDLASRTWGTVIWEDASRACDGGSVEIADLVEQNIDQAARAEPLFVRAEIERGRVGRLRASVFLRRGATWTSREIDAATCDELRRGAAVVLAMAYEMGLQADGAPDPESAGERPQAPSEPRGAQAEAERGPSAAPPNAEPQDRTAQPRPTPRRTHFQGSVAATLDYGTLPRPAAGVRGTAGIERAGWSIALGGVVLPAVSSTLADRSEGASIGALAASLQGCLPLRRGGVAAGWSLGACGAGAYGRYDASGFGMAASRSDGSVYFALGAGLHGSLALTRTIGLRADVESVFHLARPRFVVTGAGDIHQPSLVAARASIGPEVAF